MFDFLVLKKTAMRSVGFCAIFDVAVEYPVHF